MRWQLGLVLLVCGACAARGVRPSSSGPKASDYYPLAVGNQWTYEMSLLGEKRTLEVAITKEQNGFFQDSAGAQLASDAFGIRDQKRYLLREPLEVGTAWNNVVSVSSVERYKIIAAGLTCSSPSGQFENCVVVESQNRVAEGKVLINELTFAPKVGVVRIATALENNGQRVPQSTLQLLKYNLASAKPPAQLPAQPRAQP